MTGTTIARAIALLAVIQAATCNMTISPDPGSFFPEVKNNLTKIVWMHAVNSRAELEQALSSAEVMMLEADVTLGKLKINGTLGNETIPIMAHPPDTQSDLSLADFLLANIANGTKGIKLDFKSIEAFEKSKQVIEERRVGLKFPIFLNADILSGPVNATAMPLDPKAFLQGAAKIMPNCTLSVGWITRYSSKEFNITESRYSAKHMEQMRETLKENNVAQPVTYPVRAGLAANDIDVVKTLLQNSTFKATLTIWSAEEDYVDVEQLSKLIKDVGVDKVYLDVPQDLRSRLDLSAASTISSSTLTMSLVLSLALLLLSKML